MDPVDPVRLSGCFVDATFHHIAVTSFHPEIIPSSLLISIAASREIVPFPALVEAFIMEIAFEALRGSYRPHPESDRPIGFHHWCADYRDGSGAGGNRLGLYGHHRFPHRHRLFH
ncbi:spore germination protein [Paenibacillus sp. JTLBN-2024]